MLFHRRIDRTYRIGIRKVLLEGFEGFSGAAKVRKQILKFCGEDRIAKRFPTITFSLKEAADGTGSPDDSAYVFMHDAIEGTMQVFLTRKYLQTVLDGTDKRPLTATLRHELTHLRHGMEAQYRRIHMKIERIEKRFPVEEISPTSPGESRFPDKEGPIGLLKGMRTKLSVLYRNFFTEGIAQLAEFGIEDEIEYEEDALYLFRKEELRHAKSILLSWNVLLYAFKNTQRAGPLRDAMKDFDQNISIGKYRIGISMAFVIMATGKQTLRDIIAWSDHRYVKEYERACDEFGVKPIITLTSGGTLCYKKMIRELEETIRLIEAR